MSHFQLDIQSHFFIWRSEPPSLFSFGVRSHHYHVLSFWHSKPPSLFSFGFQSHHRVFRLTFRVIIITSQYRCSKPSSSIFSFGVRSHHYHVLSFRRSEPPSLFSFGFQSHHRVFFLTFRAIIITSQFRRSEPSLLSISVQSHPRRIFDFGV